MFVIPVKFQRSNPIVFECVDRIKRFHPGERILVVDSASEDKSYFGDLHDVTIADIDNVNYGTNAFHFALKNYPDEDFFYCTYDSLLLNAPIKHLKSSALSVVRYFNSPPTPMGWDENGDDLYDWAWLQTMNHMDFAIPASYTGVMGPMFFCKRKVLQDLESIGFFKIKPKNKYQLCAMERILGYTLERLGYNVQENSLQGEMTDFFGDYDKTFVEKVNVARW